jgi:thioredoxin 1
MEVDINRESFDSLKTSDKLIVIDFWAPWCGPCRMMGRVMEEIEDDEKDITFLKVDTDEVPEIAQQFGVMSIPTMVPFKDGKRVYAVVGGAKEEVIMGALPEDAFKEVLNDTFRA